MTNTSSRWLASGLWFMALGLLANAVIGPLALDLVAYPWSETINNQAIGLEAVTVALVVPWSIAAGVLAWRGHRFGPILAVAPGGYTAYMMVQYVVGPGYEVYGHAFPLHLALFIAGAATALAGWSLQAPAAFRPLKGRWWRLLPAGLALFTLSRYLPTLAGAATEEPLGDEFASDPAMFWTIVLMDLGVVVPAAVAATIAVALNAAGASKGLLALLGWFTLVPISVAAMGVAMLVNDDPHKSVATVALFGTAAAVFAAFSAWVHVRLLRGARPAAPREQARHPIGRAMPHR